MLRKIAVVMIAFCLVVGIAFADSAVIVRKITPAPGVMTADFKEAKKVITHPSGVVTEYSISHMQEQKNQLIKERDRIDAMIADVDSDVQSCSASIAGQ